MPFSKFPLHADLLRGVKELGFQRPTPIQDQAIPPAAAGKDLLACAMTGSGKTAAFLLPILHRVMNKPRGTTRALILTPTRELAAQILAHLEELAVHTPVTGAAVFGGVGMGPQEHAFRSRVDVIVATPGRLLDHLRFPYARFTGLEVLVLDEADRMLDMGFLPDIRRVLRQLPAKRQTLFFSATMPREIATLAHEMLREPVTINLERQGISVAKIHGNRSQSQRTAALQGFKAGKTRILVATDIVARGIDIEELGHVINFDVPQDPDAYIHRVGRTARAEMTGDAFTLVSPDEEQDLRAIERAIGKALPRVTLPGFDYAKKTEERLEIPVRERLAAARAARRPRRADPRGPSGPPAGRGAPAHRTGGQRKEERFRSILDRHAPAAPGPRSGPSARPGPRRGRG